MIYIPRKPTNALQRNYERACSTPTTRGYDAWCVANGFAKAPALAMKHPTTRTPAPTRAMTTTKETTTMKPKMTEAAARATLEKIANDPRETHARREKAQMALAAAGLPKAELEELQRLMGIEENAPTGPYRDTGGSVVLPTVPPSKLRAARTGGAL